MSIPMTSSLNWTGFKMKVKQLLIKRQESYESDAGQFRGMVSLIGDQGEQSLTLSPASLSKIFEVLREDATNKAKMQAKLAAFALKDAADEPLLLEQTIQVPGGEDDAF